ncbi:MAG TPA: hypothetical protein VHJ34_04175 [Actinomycetota bacterium]|nr:hypothetical protein [Actinomycetota bacterium]
MRKLAGAVAALSVAVACSGGASQDDAPGPVTGVVLEVRATSLTDVSSFVVKDGSRRVLVRVDDDTEFAFPPAHLAEHKASGEPVRVELSRRDGRLYATSVADG